MRHSYLDKYSNRSSPVHNLPVPGKTIAFLGLLLYYAFMPVSRGILAGNLAGLAILFTVARIPPLFIIKRLFVILPFLIFIVFFIPLFQGQTWRVAGETLARAGCSVLTLILFTSTTRFTHLLDSLSRLGIPKIIIQVLSFIYRYFFVLTGQLEQMKMAVRARAVRGKYRFVYRGLARMLGMLIIRSYEQSERVYNAMLMRGYDGWGNDDGNT